MVLGLSMKYEDLSGGWLPPLSSTQTCRRASCPATFGVALPKAVEAWAGGVSGNIIRKHPPFFSVKGLLLSVGCLCLRLLSSFTGSTCRREGRPQLGSVWYSPQGIGFKSQLFRTSL